MGEAIDPLERLRGPRVADPGFQEARQHGVDQGRLDDYDRTSRGDAGPIAILARGEERRPTAPALPEPALEQRQCEPRIEKAAWVTVPARRSSSSVSTRRTSSVNSMCAGVVPARIRYSVAGDQPAYRAAVSGRRGPECEEEASRRSAVNFDGRPSGHLADELGVLAGDGLPALDRDLDERRVDVDPEAAPAAELRRDEGRAAAQERVIAEAADDEVIADRPLDRRIGF